MFKLWFFGALSFIFYLNPSFMSSYPIVGYNSFCFCRWGVFDVEDCCSGVEHLASEGRIDPQKACIDGGSAGGYTTLACLAFKDTFKAGNMGFYDNGRTSYEDLIR